MTGPQDFPLVSVGMAVFNSASTLRRQIESILAQDYPNLEVLISDDGSTDGAREICQEYAAKDPRIKLTLREQNVGFVANYNSVALNAQGKYFFWADGDDCHHPAFVSTLVREMEDKPDAAIAAPAIHRVYEDGEELDHVRFSGRLNPYPMSAYKRVHMILTSRSELRSLKYNLFISGLFRTQILQSVLQDYTWPRGERGLVAELALEHKLAAVDQVLMDMTVKRRAPQEYYPDEPYLQKPRITQVEKYRSLWRLLRDSPLARKFTTRWWTLPRLALTIALEGKVRREIKKRIRAKIRSLFPTADSKGP